MNFSLKFIVIVEAQEVMLMNRLEEFRHEKDLFFLSNPYSPLPPDQKSNFNGLDYFPKNPELDLALELEEFEDKEQITM